MWATIRPGLEKTAIKADGGWIPEDVFMELKMGGAVLHLVIVDMHYKGFLVSKTFDSFDGKTLLLWIGYSEEKGRDLLVDNIHWIDEWAVKIGANRVQWQSPRKGFARVAPKLGYEQKMVIYERDLTGLFPEKKEETT